MTTQHILPFSVPFSAPVSVPVKSPLPAWRHLVAVAAMAVFAATSLPAAATTTQYTGVVDSGPLAGSLFSGSFSYADPGAGFDGTAGLDAFTLNFNAQTYTLASADAPALAWFAAGSFLGVDYVDLDSFGTAVQLTAGFTALSEALFSYQPSGAAQGLGGFTSFTTLGAVPEPAPLALVLVALGVLSGLSVQRLRAGWLPLRP